MRESIGGTWLFGIVIVFIALFTAFLAYSISYTRAFNTKNEIISYIERNEGFEKLNDNVKDDDAEGTVYDQLENMSVDKLLAADNVEANIFGMIKRSGYNYSVAEKIDCRTADHINPTPQTGGYCITKYCKSNSDEDQHYFVYYRVTTFIAIKIPFLNIVMNVPISGETKSIYYDKNNFKCEGLQSTREAISG